MTQPDAIVIGAGVAGLFCAAHLAEAGARVAVLEGRDEPGGRARSRFDAEAGMHVDIGPHVVSSEHRQFLRMLRRLGTDQHIHWQPQPLVQLLDAGEKLPVPNAAWTPPLHGLPAAPVALRRLSVLDALSQVRIAWRAARLNERTLHALDTRDILSVLQEHGVRPRAIDWFWRSALLALLNVPLEQCSAASALRVFRLMLGRSGYHFGFPTVGLSQLYVPGCRAAVESAGGSVRLATPVRTLLVEGGRCVGVRLRGGEELRARHVVMALPPSAIARLLARTGESSLQGLQQAASHFLPVPYISTTLWLDRRVTQDAFWARVWNPEDLNTDFYDLANIRPELAQGPSVITVNAIGPMVRPQWSDAQVIARTLHELAEHSPEARQARVLQARVHRIRMAIPQPRPGTESLRPPARTALEGLVFAGDWGDTAVPCSMESAARSAAMAAEGVLREAGQGRELLLPAPETYGLVGMLREKG